MVHPVLPPVSWQLTEGEAAWKQTAMVRGRRWDFPWWAGQPPFPSLFSLDFPESFS